MNPSKMGCSTIHSHAIDTYRFVSKMLRYTDFMPLLLMRSIYSSCVSSETKMEEVYA